jgi:hypothetical protein
MAMSDGGYIPKPLVYVVSPGFVIGLRAMGRASGFLDAIGNFGMTAIPVNVIYWSSILFGILSLRARSKESAETAPHAAAR